MFFVLLTYYREFFLLKEKEEKTKQLLSSEEYEVLKKRRFDFTYYATGTIKKVIYPGMYLVSFRFDDIKKYKKHKQDLEIPVEKLIGKTFLPALQMEKKDLWENCRIKIFFYGKVFFYPVDEEKGGFFTYLKNHGADYHFRIHEKNILEYSCENSLANTIRERIISIIKSQVPVEKHQGIILGLLLGNSNWMDKETKDQMKKLGLMHLFAASGLHLGILFYVLYFPASLIFGKKHYLSYLLPVPVLFLYLYILEFPYTLVRAFVFVAIVFVLTILHRRIHAYDMILNSFLVMIFVFPYDLWNLSTVMSFGAVSGILLFFPKFESLFVEENVFPSYNKKEVFLIKLSNYAKLQFFVGFTASLFLLPLQFFVFQQYSLLSPLYNFFLVPVVGVFLPFLFGVITITLIVPSQLSQEIFRHALDFLWLCVQLFMKMIDYFLNLFSGTVLWFHSSYYSKFAFVISLVFIFLILLFFSRDPRTLQEKLTKRKIFLFLYTALQILFLLLYALSFLQQKGYT